MSKQPKKAQRQVTGYWGRCLSCGQHLPLHPDLDLCGCCAFGEASELMAFSGTWTETSND